MPGGSGQWCSGQWTNIYVLGFDEEVGYEGHLVALLKWIPTPTDWNDYACMGHVNLMLEFDKLWFITVYHNSVRDDNFEMGKQANIRPRKQFVGQPKVEL